MGNIGAVKNYQYVKDNRNARSVEESSWWKRKDKMIIALKRRSVPPKQKKKTRKENQKMNVATDWFLSQLDKYPDEISEEKHAQWLTRLKKRRAKYNQGGDSSKGINETLRFGCEKNKQRN